MLESKKNPTLTSSSANRLQWEELNTLLTNNSFDDVIASLDSNVDDVDVNRRNEACGLQTLPMRLCHIESADSDKKTAIFVKLLQKNCDFSITDGSGRTLLHHVIISQCCQLLGPLKQSWNSVSMLNCPDSDGNTPLHCCVATRNLDTVSQFLRIFEDSNVDFGIKNMQGRAFI